jgi:hypothetical protein
MGNVRQEVVFGFCISMNGLLLQVQGCSADMIREGESQTRRSFLRHGSDEEGRAG